MMSILQCACCSNADPPDGYNKEVASTLKIEEQTWSEDKHLKLTFPETVKNLDSDLRNDAQMVKQLATNYGCCSCFQVMSCEGSRVLDHVLNGLEKYSKSCPRIPKLIRGATFRSEYLNAMGHSPAVLRHVSLLAGCEMIYHPMKIHQLHVNMKPGDTTGGHTTQSILSKVKVDRWHCDSTPFVLIVFCTSPDEYTGGTLQYFNGTKEEGLRLLSEGNGLPEDRVMNVGCQKKGYGVFMQGWRVFHQVTAVLTGDARTTIVFSFHPRNVLSLEACSHLSQTYAPVDPLYIIMPDWVRFRAWKAARRLQILREQWNDQYIETNLLECSEMMKSIEMTYNKLAHIVESLPYCSHRSLFTSRLLEAVVDLRTYLWATYPDRMTFKAAAPVLDDAHDTCMCADTYNLKVSVSSVADLEKFTPDSTEGHVKRLEFEPEFLDSPLGLANLLGAIEDIDNCIDDVLTLKEHESLLVYF